MSSGFKIKQVPERKMELSFALLQSLQILQMPQLELATWLKEEIEKNPLFELNGAVSKKEEFVEMAAKPSLYEFLQGQILDTISNPQDRKIAEELIGHLDEKGFISTPLEEIAAIFSLSLERIESVLRVIQTFHPPGIGARNLQEALLIQMLRLDPILRKNILPYRLVSEFFDDLLHGRYTILKKKIGASPTELAEAIRFLAHLQLRPASGYKEIIAPILTPDIRVVKLDQNWAIEVDEEELPTLQIRTDYLSLLNELRSEEKKALKTWHTSAKWLLRSVSRRRNLLYKLSSYLVKKQSDFLDQKGPLVEISVTDLAQLLGLHESTIHRALIGKMIETPRGVVPLKSLTSNSPQNDQCKHLLQKLIEQENKEKPLTDTQIVTFLKNKGFKIARRTVAKYRTELKIGSALQRKVHQ